MQCIDVATHTVSALTSLAGMARAVGDNAVAERCASLYPIARARLEAAFWMEEEGLYGDMLASPRQMMPRLQAWLEDEEGAYYASSRAANVRANLMDLLRRAKSDPEPDRKRAWLLKHWIVASPIEAGIAPRERADRALERLNSSEFVGPYGMYISGMDRAHAMSVSTGALAVAQATYGRAEQAVESVRVMTDSLDAHMPGAISEISPSSGCFVQAWSGYAVAWPLVTHVFGLQPDTHRREIRLKPHFPAAWPEASLSNVRVGATTVDLHWNGSRAIVEVHEPGWKLTSSFVAAEMRII